MKTHFQLTDEQFQHQFFWCILDPALFTHEAHLRLAWIHIKKFGVETAVYTVTEQLKRFVNHLGAENKFNKTLTIAAVRAVNHFMMRSDVQTFEEFIIQFPKLKNNFRKLISSHYTEDIFNSRKAKEQYLEPDLLPF